jgi:hypothetical protein
LLEQARASMGLPAAKPAEPDAYHRVRAGPAGDQSVAARCVVSAMRVRSAPLIDHV